MSKVGVHAMKTKKCGLVSRIIILALGLGLLAPAARAQTNGAGFTPAQIAANQALLQAADAPDQPSGPNHRTTLRHTPRGHAQNR